MSIPGWEMSACSVMPPVAEIDHSMSGVLPGWFADTAPIRPRPSGVQSLGSRDIQQQGPFFKPQGEEDSSFQKGTQPLKRGW